MATSTRRGAGSAKNWLNASVDTDLTELAKKAAPVMTMVVIVALLAFFVPYILAIETIRMVGALPLIIALTVLVIGVISGLVRLFRYRKVPDAEKSAAKIEVIATFVLTGVAALVLFIGGTVAFAAGQADYDLDDTEGMFLLRIVGVVGLLATLLVLSVIGLQSLKRVIVGGIIVIVGSLFSLWIIHGWSAWQLYGDYT